MPGDSRQGNPQVDLRLDIGDDPFHDFVTAEHRVLIFEDQRVGVTQQIRIAIGLASHHHPVHQLEMLAYAVQGFDTTIQNDLEIRKIPFEAMNRLVFERG